MEARSAEYLQNMEFHERLVVQGALGGPSTSGQIPPFTTKRSVFAEELETALEAAARQRAQDALDAITDRPMES